MARKNSLIAVSTVGSVVTFTVADTGEFSIDTATLPSEIADKALVHGLVQKISDAAAFPKADNATPTDKLAAMQAVADRLKDGDWSKRNGDGSGPVAGVIFRAFSEWVSDSAKAKKAAPPTAEKIRAVYDAKSRAEQLALRNVPAIATIIERIKSEKGSTASAVDTDNLLGELGL